MSRKVKLFITNIIIAIVFCLYALKTKEVVPTVLLYALTEFLYFKSLESAFFNYGVFNYFLIFPLMIGIVALANYAGVWFPLIFFPFDAILIFVAAKQADNMRSEEDINYRRMYFLKYRRYYEWKVKTKRNLREKISNASEKMQDGFKKLVDSL